MHFHKLLPVIVAGTVALTAGTAAASTIWTINHTLEAGTKIDGAGSSDFTFPVATKNQTKLKGGSDTITAEAMQTFKGVSSVEVNVSHFGTDALAAGGYTEETTASAKAYHQRVFRNPGTTAIDLGTFDFRISGVELEVSNGGGFGSNPPVVPEAKIAFDAFVLGGDSYHAEMTLRGEYNNFQIINAQGFSGTVQRQECFATTCLRGFVDVGVLTGSLNLGVLNPGEEIILVTDLMADITFAGIEIGARVVARDPNGAAFFATSFDDPSSPPAVPLPATGWMLIAALAGAAALRRRQSI